MIKNWFGIYLTPQILLNTDENHITNDTDFQGGVTIQSGQTVYVDGNYYFKFAYPSTIQGTQTNPILMRPDKSLTTWSRYYWTDFERSDLLDTNLITIKWLQLQGNQNFCPQMNYVDFENCHISAWNIFRTNFVGTTNISFSQCTFNQGYWRMRMLDSALQFDNCKFDGVVLAYDDIFTGTGKTLTKNFCHLKGTRNRASGLSSPGTFNVIMNDCVLGKANSNYTGTAGWLGAMSHGLVYIPLRSGISSYVTLRRCLSAGGVSSFWYDHGFKGYDSDFIGGLKARYMVQPQAFSGVADNCYVENMFSQGGYDPTNGSSFDSAGWENILTVTNARSSRYNTLDFSNDAVNIVGDVATFSGDSGALANVEIQFGETTSYGMQSGFPSTFRDGTPENPGTSFKRIGHSIVLDVSKLRPGTYHWRFRGVEPETEIEFFGTDQTFAVSATTPQVPVIITIGQSTDQIAFDVAGTCQTEQCYIKAYAGSVDSGQGVLVAAGTTTWTIEKVGLALGANVITATSDITDGGESAESVGITLTRTQAAEAVETITVEVESDEILVTVENP